MYACDFPNVNNDNMLRLLVLILDYSNIPSKRDYFRSSLLSTASDFLEVCAPRSFDAAAESQSAAQDGTSFPFGSRRLAARLRMLVVDHELVPLPLPDLEHGVDIQPVGRFVVSDAQAQLRFALPGDRPLLRVAWRPKSSSTYA